MTNNPEQFYLFVYVTTLRNVFLRYATILNVVLVALMVLISAFELLGIKNVSTYITIMSDQYPDLLTFFLPSSSKDVVATTSAWKTMAYFNRGINSLNSVE